MKKTMYIPKGQECRFDNLTCERIVVNGSLHVDGRLKTKHVCGKGFVYAKWITAASITAHTVDADTISTDTLVAAYVNAFDIHAIQGMAVSSLITANYVKTERISYSDAEIRDLQAAEVIKLSPKRRSLLRTLLESYVRSKWTELMHSKPRPEPEPDREIPDTQEPSYQDSAPPVDMQSPELAEALRLLDDPEFLRLKAMFKLTQGTGDIWQLVKKKEQTDRAVTVFTEAA